MKIYVGNLPFSTNEASLRQMFEAHGDVASASIVMDRETGRPRGFGFVEMSNDEEARKAIEAMNGQSIEGRALVVNEARPREDRGGGGVLLGRYEGVPLTRRDPTGYAGVAPDRITIFQGPLCARATDEADLAAQVRTTVLHEIGHYFGLSDARLRELGWA